MSQLFQNDSTLLFDFDGLLVNTEQLHYEAYRKLVEGHGDLLSLNFIDFAAKAHTSSTALKSYLLDTFPSLNDVPWDKLYAEKQHHFLSLLTAENLEFMPGADAMIEYALDRGLSMCVVTNSSARLTDEIRKHLHLLNEIPLWITRECYENPKPAPDGYLTALEHFKIDAGQAIGFEDSLRGIHSLQNAGVFPVLICDPSHPQCSAKEVEKLTFFETFIELLEALPATR